MLDLRFGFLVKNYVYSRLERLENPEFRQKITKSSLGQVVFIASGGYSFLYCVLALYTDAYYSYKY